MYLHVVCYISFKCRPTNIKLRIKEEIKEHFLERFTKFHDILCHYQYHWESSRDCCRINRLCSSRFVEIHSPCFVLRIWIFLQLLRLSFITFKSIYLGQGILYSATTASIWHPIKILNIKGRHSPYRKLIFASIDTILLGNITGKWIPDWRLWKLDLTSHACSQEGKGTLWGNHQCLLLC